MSDGIICAVEGCAIEAEIEIERKGESLWLCFEHYKIFFQQKALCQICGESTPCNCNNPQGVP
jgi:hypothetical protein